MVSLVLLVSPWFIMSHCMVGLSHPHFGVQFLCYADDTCMVCLRGELLILLLSVKLAAVVNFITIIMNFFR